MPNVLTAEIPNIKAYCTKKNSYLEIIYIVSNFTLIYTVHWAQSVAGSCDTEAIPILFNMTATKVMAGFFS
jgi:hypothetical protein